MLVCYDRQLSPRRTKRTLSARGRAGSGDFREPAAFVAVIVGRFSRFGPGVAGPAGIRRIGYSVLIYATNCVSGRSPLSLLSERQDALGHLENIGTQFLFPASLRSACRRSGFSVV